MAALLPLSKLTMMIMTAGTTLAFTNNPSSSNYCHYYHRRPTAIAAAASPPPSAPRLLLNEIRYRRNIFSKQELQIIQEDLMQYLGKLEPETSSTVAHGRRGKVLPRDSPTVHMFQQGSLVNWINETTGQLHHPHHFSTWQLRHEEVPVEIRSYEQSGAGMSWHTDDVLYTPHPQLEVVWTLENTSDCQTLYRTGQKDKSSITTAIESIQTENNSVLLVPAGGPEHCVTSLQRGKRIIVKGVYALQDCQLLPNAHVPQFHKEKSKKKRRKR
jgi:hypothetical protein